jgi:hypothetical protein
MATGHQRALRKVLSAYSFTVFLAGAGVKAGMSYGETDDFSYNIVTDPVHVHGSVVRAILA